MSTYPENGDQMFWGQRHQVLLKTEIRCSEGKGTRFFEKWRSDILRAKAPDSSKNGDQVFWGQRHQVLLKNGDQMFWGQRHQILLKMEIRCSEGKGTRFLEKNGDQMFSGQRHQILLKIQYTHIRLRGYYVREDTSYRSHRQISFKYDRQTQNPKRLRLNIK